MDEIGEYHAKWDKPISKNQKTNDLGDKPMMIHNRGWEGGKNGGRMDCIEEKEGWGGVEGRKNNRMRQTSLLYVHVWLYKWFDSTLCTTRETTVVPHLCTMNQNK